MYKETVRNLQESLLGGKYLDRALFDNITADECKARYNSNFITSGTAFAVLKEPDIITPGISTFHRYCRGTSPLFSGFDNPLFIHFSEWRNEWNYRK